MVAANCWPLGRYRLAMTIEMVNLPFLAMVLGSHFPALALRRRRVGLLRVGEVHQGGGA